MANAIEIGGAMGEGLQQSMGNLLQVARESREVNSPEYKLKQAMSAEAYKDFTTKIKREDLEKKNPYAPHLIEAAKASGLIVGDEQEFSLAQIKQAQKYFGENPRVLASIVDKTYQENLKQDREFGAALKTKQDELAKLTLNPGDKILNAKKIENLTKEISEIQAQHKPFLEGRERDSMLRDRLKIVIQAKDYEKLSAEDKLIYQALQEKGEEPTAENILKKKQELKQNPSDHYTIRNKKTGQEKSIRLASGEMIPEGWERVKDTVGMQTDERRQLRFDTLISKAASDPTVRQYLNTQGAKPRIARAYEDYKSTGNAAMLDDAILYAINKMNDPDSVVMIGEYMRTAGLQSWWGKIKGNVGAITNDQARISDKFRTKLYDAVAAALTDREKLYNQRMTAFRSRAKKYSNDESEINEFFPLAGEKLSAMSEGSNVSVNTPATGRVKVQSPSGQIGTIPTSQLDSALTQGFKQVQ